MNALNRWRRPVALLTAVAAVAPLAATANAEPARTATTTKYTRAVYLQKALGLPASNTNPVIDSVTYDRFQHLLRETGNFAILIGDPATDDKFAERARGVETAATAAGVKKVYWFNPNLSGGVKVGTITEPNLDIRNAAGITTLNALGRGRFKDAWSNLIAQSLGNGLTSARTDPGAQGQYVTISQSDAVNDATNPIFDYTGGATPADVQDSYFLVYNAANKTAGNQADKIVSWVNLTDDAAAATKVTTAITAVGGANFAQVSQFTWWKAEANERSRVAAGPNPANGAGVPVVTDADNAAADGGWRVNQITYPELITLLESSTDADAVILFGGTWCPNTRAVLPFINKDAQRNNVTVYNFDTVLDGGVVGGNPTSTTNPVTGPNPLQTRNNHNNGLAPSFLYGELVNQYLSNFNTEYTTTNRISFFPGGDQTQPATTVKRLQVPFLLSYKAKGGTEPQAGVTRQWLQSNANGTFTEYMSHWWFTNPKPNNLGITALPQTAPIWAKINADLAGYTGGTDISAYTASRAVFTDASQYLIDDDTATFNQSGTGGSGTQPGPINISPASLATTLTALAGTTGGAPTTLAEARAAHVAARADADPTRLNLLATVIAAWNIADNRKDAVNRAWGPATSPDTIAGAAAAKRAGVAFFDGLPGGVVTTRKVTANAITVGAAATIDLTIANDYGRTPAGNVSLVVKKGGTNVTSASTAVANGAAAFSLPGLEAGTYDFTLSYVGDDQIAGFTENGTLTVNPIQVDPTPTATPVVISAPTATPTPTINKVKATKLAGAVATAPTSKKAGKYKVTITTPKAGTKATGKVTLKLKKGKTTKTITGTVKNGTVTVSVPKLAKGTWKVSISWVGDSKYLAATVTGTSIKVKK